MTATAGELADQDQATLPGLDLVGRGAGDRSAPALERLALGYVAELNAGAQLADPADQLIAAMVVDLARAVGLSARAGKAAGAAMAGRQLLDAIAALREHTAPADGPDEWAQVVAALAPAEVA